MPSMCIILTFQGGIMFEFWGGDGKRIRFERLAGSAKCAMLAPVQRVYILVPALFNSHIRMQWLWGFRLSY